MMAYIYGNIMMTSNYKYNDQELDAHVVDVIYTLLDEDGDENLSTREFNPILFQWRHSRGFQKGSLAMSVGSLRF